MKMLLVVIFVAALAALNSNLLTPDDTSHSDDETAVLAKMKELQDAGMRRDVAALGQIYSENYFHTNPNGSIMLLADVVASYKAPAPAVFDSNQADEYRLQLFEGNTAVVSNRVTLHGKKMNGQEFTSRFRVTTVLVKTNRQ